VSLLSPETTLAVQAAQQKNAQDVLLLNVGEHSSIADIFMICTATNSRQVQAISDGIQESLKLNGWRVLGIEGYRQAEWILMDYGDLVVHVFLAETRKFYDLERLWKNARKIPVPAEAA
jgi:ribosome-associated protein